MNFVLIVSDTFRWDHLGVSGNDWIRTPNLDRFAGESVIFDRAYTGSFPTIPHRTDVMTGKWVHPYRGWSPLPKQEAILSQTLANAGYVTMMIVDCPHLMKGGHNFDRGFDAWKWNRGQEGDAAITEHREIEPLCPPEKCRSPERMKSHHYLYRDRHWNTERDTFAARTMQDAADWIELNYKHENFFLYVDAFDPHEPWDPPQHYIDMYDPGYEGEAIDHPKYDWQERVGWTDREMQNIKARYAGEVTLIDTWVQRIFEKIAHCGIADDTCVIFHADHGHLVGDHGRIAKSAPPEDRLAWPFYEEISHVPLIIRMPGGLKSERNHFLAQGVDLMPTILDIAGLEIPDGVKGVSLAPALRGEEMPKREVAVTTPGTPPGSASHKRKMSSITDGEFTLHYRGNEHPWELFNIQEDPAQENDLSKSHREVAERLHGLYLEQMRFAGETEEKLAQRSVLPE